MIKVDVGATDKRRFTGLSIIGMQFSIIIQHLTANTAFTANPVDLSLIKVKLSFFKKKSGMTHQIFNDSLLPLVLHSGFYGGGFQQNLQIGTFVTNVLTAAASSVDEVISINSSIRFDRVINCIEPGDELNFDIQNPAGAYGATASAPESFFYYDIVEGVGLGDSVPQIALQSVPPAVSSDKFSGGEGVQSMSYINTDKSGITAAVQVLVNTSFQGDKLGDVDDYYDVLSKRNMMFEDIGQGSARNQTFRLYDVRLSNLSGMPVRMDRVDVNATFNSSNVTAGKNWWAVSRLVNDPAVYHLYRSKIQGQVQANAMAPAV